MFLQTYDEPANTQEITATLAHDYLGDISTDSKSVFLKNRVLKNTAIAALVSLPTMIEPVIASQADTIILSESFSPQLTLAPSHSKPEESIASIVLASVLEGYAIHNSDSVEGYLAANSDLLEFLIFVSCKLKQVEAIESIELEHYHDSEEGWDKLFVVANTQLEDMDVLDQLEADLFGSLFEPKMPWLSGRVVLSIG